MTDEMMNLRTLVEKTPDADLLREMIGLAAERLMELEVASLTGARYGENCERLNQPSGYRGPACDGRFDALMAVGDDQLHAPQAGRGPERLRLRVADVHGEHYSEQARAQ